MNEKYFDFLDKLRLSGKSYDNYTKRELLSQEFSIGVTRANRIVESYNKSQGNRKQFLAESL